LQRAPSSSPVTSAKASSGWPRNNADYLVIEKFGEAGEVAEDTDPRT
jgi:hypothetical protein